MKPEGSVPPNPVDTASTQPVETPTETKSSAVQDTSTAHTITRRRVLGAGIGGVLATIFGLRRPGVASGAEVILGASEDEEKKRVSEERRDGLRKRRQIWDRDSWPVQRPAEQRSFQLPEPLTPEQQRRLIEDFKTMTQVIKDSVKPQALQDNPIINFESLISNPQRLEAYRSAGWLGVEEYKGISEAGIKPGERYIWFYPQGSSGGISIFVHFDPNGVKSGTINHYLDKEGHVTEPNWRDGALSIEEAKQVIEEFFNLPNAKKQWQFARFDNPRVFPNNRQLNLDATGKDGTEYYIFIDQRGWSTFAFDKKR